MSLRETINRRPGIAVAASAGVIVVAIAVIYWESGPRGVGADADTGLVHYTTDDGATWFADSADKYPQFKKDGKDAYRANVYRDADGKEFVAYMERRSTQSSEATAALESMTPEQRAMDPTAVTMGGTEVKRPGDKTWYRDTDPRAQQVLQPRSPSGKTEGLTYVQAR